MQALDIPVLPVSYFSKHHVLIERYTCEALCWVLGTWHRQASCSRGAYNLGRNTRGTRAWKELIQPWRWEIKENWLKRQCQERERCILRQGGREGFSEEAIFEPRQEWRVVKGPVAIWGSVFQAEGMASAKALGLACGWNVRTSKLASMAWAEWGQEEQEDMRLGRSWGSYHAGPQGS